MLENRRVDIREKAEDLNNSYEQLQHILVNVSGMKYVNAGFNQKNLHLLQKLGRVEITNEMLDN